MMALQHDVLEHRASARVSVRNHLKRTGHSLEFHPEEHLGLVSGRIRCWIKKAFHCLVLGNASHKFEREFDIELHGTDDDRVKRRGWQKLTVWCRELARWFTRH
jgi:hypothetical protein